MSAFLVEHKTINRIVSFFTSGKNSYYRRKLKELNPQFDLDTFKGRETLGRAMFTLNIQVVHARYDSGVEDFGDLNYHYRTEISHRYQALKSLRCWLYQCAEGNIPETSKLFQLLEKFSGEIALDIIKDTPEYEKALWG